MKKSIFTFLLLTFLGASLVAQIVPGEKLVPANVKAKFKTEYPDASILKWEIKPVLKEYVAVFRQTNLSKRARYNSQAEALLLVTSYQKAQIPAVYTSKVIGEYANFMADWATEFKFFKGNQQHFIELRLSKPGYVLKAWVKPDGSTNASNGNKEISVDGDPIQDENQNK